MKITLFMVTSLNSITSRPDMREDFLEPQNWDSFVEYSHRVGAMVWGRRTQDKIRTSNKKYFDDLQGINKIVVSSQADFRLEEGFTLASSAEDAMAKFKSMGHEDVVLGGGSVLNASFARAKLIDEVIVNIQSVIVGKGIPLFAPGDFDINLEFLESKKVNEAILQLKYIVTSIT